MAVAKAAGESWKTELNMPNFSHVPASAPIADLSKAKIALLTTCGPVPIGNPDHLEAHTCSKWETYRPEDFGGEDMPATEIAHGGYTPVYGTNNGNRVVPVDAMLELEKEVYWIVLSGSFCHGREFYVCNPCGRIWRRHSIDVERAGDRRRNFNICLRNLHTLRCNDCKGD